MSIDANFPEPTEWVQHTAFLRKLAIGLVSDEARAEDAVQEAWLALAQGPSVEPRSLRAWLSGAVRNLLASRGREDARRSAREEVVARTEIAAGSDESVERLEIARRLVDELEQLPAETREVLVMRFFDELPPREIAQRLSQPVNTVRSRTRRGIEELRERLGGDRGREQLLGALAPLIGAQSYPVAEWAASKAATLHASPKLGVKAMTWTLRSKLVVASVCAVALLPVLTGDDDPDSDVPTEIGAAAVEAPTRVDLRDPRVAGAEVGSSTAAEPGHVPNTPNSAPATRVEAAPAGEWRVAGFVGTDPWGAGPGLGGVEVEVQVLAGYEGGEVVSSMRRTSDAEGQFACAFPEPGRTVRVKVSSLEDGYFVWETSERLVILGDEPPQDLELWLAPVDSVVRGFVHDEHGSPIRGARARSSQEETAVGADGRFELRAAESFGAIRIGVWAPGYAYQQLALSSRAGGGSFEVDVELKRGATLRGRVFDPEGHPEPGVRVHAGMGSSVVVESDSEGRYELTHIDPGPSHCMVVGEKEGFVRARVHHPIPDSMEFHLDLHLGQQVAVEGRVVDSKGAPIAGANVFIAESPIHGDRFVATSRDDGSFVMPGAPLGWHTLWVERRGYVRGSRELHVQEPASTRTGIEVVLVGGRSIDVRVQDTFGKPVRRAWVQAKRGWKPQGNLGRTGRDGIAKLVGLPDRGVEIDVGGSGILRAVASVPDDSTARVNVVVERSGGLVGRVLDHESGEPVKAFTVKLGRPTLLEGECATFAREGSWVLDGRPFSSVDGKWATGVSELEPGCLIGVEVSAPGYVVGVNSRALVTSRPEEHPIEIRLTRGRTVRGRVVGVDESVDGGVPLQGARVRRYTPQHKLKYAQEDVLLTAITDIDGRFQMDAVPPGQMFLAVDHPDWTETSDGPFTVPLDGGLEDRAIVLTRGATLSGHWLDRGRAPLPNVLLRLNARDVPMAPDRVHSSTTDGYGAFRFEELAPGAYELFRVDEYSGNEIETEVRFFELGEGEAREQDLFPPGDACFSGMVVSDAPASTEMLVEAVRLDEPARPHDPTRWTVGVDGGRFQICGLSRGRYRLVTSFYAAGRVLRGETTATIEGNDENVRVTLEVVKVVDQR